MENIFHRMWVAKIFLLSNMGSSWVTKCLIEYRITIIFLYSLMTPLEVSPKLCIYLTGSQGPRFESNQRLNSAYACLTFYSTSRRLRWLSWMPVRLETRRSQVWSPPRSATFFHGDWSWNIFYGHSLPSADSRRAVVSFWRKNVHNTG